MHILNNAGSDLHVTNFLRKDLYFYLTSVFKAVLKQFCCFSPLASEQPWDKEGFCKEG